MVVVCGIIYLNQFKLLIFVNNLNNISLIIYILIELPVCTKAPRWIHFPVNLQKWILLYILLSHTLLQFIVSAFRHI